MAKMGKRQMIILGVMAIAILYAAFVYLAPQKKVLGVDMAQKTAELKTFVTDLNAGLGKDSSKNLLSKQSKEDILFKPPRKCKWGKPEGGGPG